MAYEDVASNYESLQDHEQRIKILDQRVTDEVDHLLNLCQRLKLNVNGLTARLDDLEAKQVE